ncbi:MAG: SIMPL domain-containing protein [Agriterribacter sp.]
MKKTFLTVVVIAFACISMAQINTNPYPKTISVTGSAEIEIIPDEIYVQVDLREYEKKGAGKIDIETIKAKFLQACKTVGIADSNISIASYEGADLFYWLTKKKKTPDMMASISYQVKFSSSNKIDQLVEQLDDQATQGFQITKTSHSKMTEYRKQLKIQAIKAAKEKAIYLSEAVGEKAGEAVTIQEPAETPDFPIYNEALLSNKISQSRMQSTAGFNESGAVDFKKIKLRYEVSAVFALK